MRGTLHSVRTRLSPRGECRTVAAYQPHTPSTQNVPTVCPRPVARCPACLLCWFRLCRSRPQPRGPPWGGGEVGNGTDRPPQGSAQAGGTTGNGPKGPLAVHLPGTLKPKVPGRPPYALPYSSESHGLATQTQTPRAQATGRVGWHNRQYRPKLYAVCHQRIRGCLLGLFTEPYGERRRGPSASS